MYFNITSSTCKQMIILLSDPLGNATWPRSNSDTVANGIEHCLIMEGTLGVVICHQKHGHMTSHCCLTTSICSRTFELIKSSMFRTERKILTWAVGAHI